MGMILEELKEEFQLADRKSDTKVIRAIIDKLSLIDGNEAKALSLSAQASIATISGNYDEAMKLNVEAMDLYHAVGDELGIAVTIGDQGSIYWMQGDYPTALEYLHKAISLYDKLKEEGRVAGVLNNIGIVYNEMSDFSSSLDYYRRSYAVHEKLGNKAGMATCLVNIGIVYGEIGDSEEALRYYDKNLKINEEIDNRGGKANVLGNIGSAYADMEKYEEAERYFKEAIDLARELGLSREQGYYLNGLSRVYIDIDRIDEAITLQKDNAEIISVNHGPQTDSMVIKAKICCKKEAFDEAKEHLNTALEQALSRNERQGVAGIHKELRDLAKEMGDFEGYIEHNEEYQKIESEIKGSESTRKLTVQEKEREVEEERHQREEEKRQQELEHEKERAILYGALPSHVVDRLVKGEQVTDHYDNASVMFLDLVGFTRIASRVPAGHVVHLLEAIFATCDEVCQKYEVTKIKTIGDSYMAVAGVPDQTDDHVIRAAKAATEIQHELENMRLTMPPELGDTSWVEDIGELHARVGVHCGPVVAGVVGKDRLQYDVWGDAVNVASRMESTGEPGRVQVSEDFAKCLPPGEWHLDKRVAQEVKGKGMMQTYWLEAIDPDHTT